MFYPRSSVFCFSSPVFCSRSLFIGETGDTFSGADGVQCHFECSRSPAGKETGDAGGWGPEEGDVDGGIREGDRRR